MLGSVSFVLRATQGHPKLLRRKERVSYLDLGRGLRGEGGERGWGMHLRGTK